MKTLSLIRRISFVGIFAIASIALPLSATDEKQEKWEKALAGLRDQNRETVVKRLRVHISEIDRASSLNDKQRAKLEIAAKGAAEHTVETWINGLSNQKSLMDNLEAAAINAPKGKKPDLNQLLAQWGRGIRAENAPKAEVWTDAVKDTLSVTQQTLWKSTQEERARFARLTQISNIVNGADQTLRLSQKQREQLSKLLDELPEKPAAKNNAGGAVRIQAQNRIVIQNQIRFVGNGGAIALNGNGQKPSPGLSLANIPRKKIEAILDETQMDLWESVTKPAVANNGFFGGGFEGIIIN